jgi:hypothetical protein
MKKCRSAEAFELHYFVCVWKNSVREDYRKFYFFMFNSSDCKIGVAFGVKRQFIQHVGLNIKLDVSLVQAELV